MPHDPLTLLHDIKESVEFILDRTRQCDLDTYQEDVVLSAAVERHFITIGEALNRLTRRNADLASSLGDYPQVISFRNVIVHGYDIIEDAIVWGVIENELPALLDAVRLAIANLKPGNTR